MFTGIIESIGEIVAIEREASNIHIMLRCSFTYELQIDQSLAHDGVCLTIVAIDGDCYTVTAINEKLQKSTLGDWGVGALVNLERAMTLGARLDGHLVQGHVDQVGSCVSASEEEGSWRYQFTYDTTQGNITVEKGSVTVNGVSLTVVDSGDGTFSVAIIPYTHAHTNFNQLFAGKSVNLEFDVIGKYVARLTQAYR